MKKLYLIILIIGLTGCFNNNNNASMNILFNPDKLDPQRTVDSNSKFILSHIFEGLTAEDEKGKIVPAVAESWKVEGTVWTFIINSNAKWQNGKKVKAQDFITAWERVISPINGNENAYEMFMIKNAMEYNQGKVSLDFVGIKAVDDKTLVVELKEEVSNFDSIAAQTIFYPVNKEFYESHRIKYGLGKKNILGNGFYKISKWKDSKEISLKRNKNHQSKTGINRINLLINGMPKEVKKMYEENKIGVLNLPVDELAEYNKNKEQRNFETGEVSFIQFNTNEKLFSNAKIRKAISMIIDRKEYIDQFQFNIGTEAQSFIPGSIPGKSGFFRVDYPQNVYEIDYNPEKAKVLFQEGLKELGMNYSDIKNISLLVKTHDVEIAAGNFIKKQLRENLDLNITVEPETAQMRKQIIFGKNYGFTLESYNSTVSDGGEYLGNWTSWSFNNLTAWQNAGYDNLVKNALKEKDYDKRINLLHEAERLLMSELPIIPLSFSKKSFIVKDKIKNLRLSNISGELDFRYADIEESK